MHSAFANLKALVLGKLEYYSVQESASSLDISISVDTHEAVAASYTNIEQLSLKLSSVLLLSVLSTQKYSVVNTRCGKYMYD